MRNWNSIILALTTLFALVLATYSWAGTYTSPYTDFRADGEWPGEWEAPSALKEFTTEFKREATLASGMGTFCNEKEFRVENRSDSIAELKVIMGEDEVNVQLQPKSQKAYNLMTPGADPEKEVRIVNSTPGNAMIEVECRK